MTKAYDIIKKPVLTEKSYAEMANKKYTFEVAITAIKCAMPEEFPDFPRDEYLVRDEYNNPPEKKKKKTDPAKEEPHTDEEGSAQ